MKTQHLILPILISIVLLGCRKPDPDPPEQHYIRQEVRDWGYFEEGSYWVFQNDSTLTLDTLRVTNIDTIKTGYKKDSKLTGLYSRSIFESDIYYGFLINIEGSLSDADIFLNFYERSSVEEEVTIIEGLFLKTELSEINQFGQKQFIMSNNYMLLSWDDKKLNNKILNKEGSSWKKYSNYYFHHGMQILEDEVNVYEIDEILDNYSLNGKTYNNVYHIKSYSLTNERYYYPEYYISDFWIVKNVGIIKKVFRHYNGFILSQSLIDHRVYQ